MIVDRKEIEGLKPVAEGYKVFNNDWTAYGNYCYADENGNVEGIVHKQEGVIEICKNGFHFCENILNCFRYYPCLQSNKFAKVKGYGRISRDNDDTKVAVEILEIVKILTSDEFLKEITTKYSGITLCYGIINGRGISNSSEITDCSGIENSSNIYRCKYIKDCKCLLNSIMCLKTTGSYKIFNKKITKTYYKEINEKIKDLAYDWHPKFTNTFALNLINGSIWEFTFTPKIMETTTKEAYKDMPKKLIEYFKSLPEFDAKIFKEITGIEV